MKNSKVPGFVINVKLYLKFRHRSSIHFKHLSLLRDLASFHVNIIVGDQMTLESSGNPFSNKVIQAKHLKQ